MPDRHRRLGVGHLTALDLAPPDLVTTAARAGFDSVGVRVATANDQERRWPVDVGSPMLLETVRRLRDTGLTVLDVEITSLGPDTRVADCDRALDVGVRLGARFLNVLCDDPDLDRAADTFAALVERAELYEIRPAVEAMSYKQVSSLDQARRVAERSAGGGVLLDSLHLLRCGTTLDEVRALDPALLTYLQIADAPRHAPTAVNPSARLPRNQAFGGTPAQWESLAARQTPGEGELDLRALLAAVPVELPVSVEAPNLARVQALGQQEFLRHHHDAARALLDSASTPQSIG